MGLQHYNIAHREMRVMSFQRKYYESLVLKPAHARGYGSVTLHGCAVMDHTAKVDDKNYLSNWSGMNMNHYSYQDQNYVHLEKNAHSFGVS